MKRRVALGVLALVLLAAPVICLSGDNLDWADEFQQFTVKGRRSLGTIHLLRNFGLDEVRQWELLGIQGLTGASNTEERNQMSIIDDSVSDCLTVTLNSARWRKPSPPTFGSTCDGTVSGLTSLGSVSRTVDQCTHPLGDRSWSMRQLPVWNFASESGVPANAYMGYVSKAVVTASAMTIDPVSGQAFSCYRIYWL